MLGPSPGAKARGDHTMGGGVLTLDTRAYIHILRNVPCAGAPQVAARLDVAHPLLQIVVVMKGASMCQIQAQ